MDLSAKNVTFSYDEFIAKNKLKFIKLKDLCLFLNLDLENTDLELRVNQDLTVFITFKNCEFKFIAFNKNTLLKLIGDSYVSLDFFELVEILTRHSIAVEIEKITK